MRIGRLVGNDKVPPEVRDDLRHLKAVRQGIQLGGGRWWPALAGLDAEAEARARAAVRDFFLWQAEQPVLTTDGRRVR